MAQHVTDLRRTRERRFRMSYEEFLAWAGEDVHAEWVDGEVTVFMPAKRFHQDVLFFFAKLLSEYAEDRELGTVMIAPFEVRLRAGRSARQPDAFFVTRAHFDRLSVDRLDGPPDLIVELVSDDSVARDRAEKLAEYEAAGVLEYCILDPRPGKQRTELYRLMEDGKYRPVLPDADGRYHSAVLVGFWFRPEWLWQTPFPRISALLREIEGSGAPPTHPGRSAEDGSAKDR